MRVLLIEECVGAAAGLRAALYRFGITSSRLAAGDPRIVDLCADADVVLLDLGPREVGNSDTCRSIREASDIPLIILSARREVQERIAGLYQGADDFLVAPYNVRELVARISAVTRRRAKRPHGTDRVLVVDDVTVDIARRTVAVDGVQVNLSPKEFQLVTTLAAADGAVCSRGRLVMEVWGREVSKQDRSLDVLVANLRAKIGADLVRTVHGVGYRLARRSESAQEPPRRTG